MQYVIKEANELDFIKTFYDSQVFKNEGLHHLSDSTFFIIIQLGDNYNGLLKSAKRGL